MHPHIYTADRISEWRSMCERSWKAERGGYRLVDWESCFHEALLRLADDPRMASPRDAGRLVYWTFYNCVKDAYKKVRRRTAREQGYAESVPSSALKQAPSPFVEDEIGYLRYAIECGALGTAWIQVIRESQQANCLPREMKRMLPSVIDACFRERGFAPEDVSCDIPDRLSGYAEYRRALRMTQMMSGDDAGDTDAR